ncbi:MAG TPA: TonB-dependent receptor [Vicinamibacterales bacterium]|nr:TonB-dependent receptor [Vicinamibacterales bacterium]
MSSAQQLTLSGTVRDTSGVVPGATVVLSAGGNEVSTVMTDQAGAYRFTGLTAGSYEVSFVMRGFETAVRNVNLGPDTRPVDVVLTVGRVSTTLTVTASAGKATASRLPVANTDVPAQVSSIPQELMRQQSVNTVGEALRNASGVQAVRWYGAYEQYTIRGFFDDDRDSFNTMLVDGMRMGGNRYSTQTNSIQSVEVLKGPSSVLYGRGAVGGAINVIRKKPQATRAYDFSYRGGRFNTHQVAAGATGPIGDTDRFLYRFDGGYEASAGWRDAGADRLNIAPSLTWLMNENARLTVHQNFNRDRFDGDGGVPFNIIDLPSYTPDLRFSIPQDNVLVEDSQTQLLFNGNVSPRWEFRNAFLVQRTSDRYFVTEGVYGDPENNEVFREPLDFHHIRRPIQNQAELLGRVEGFGLHNLLFGYEYQRDKYRTEVTAGDDPDCVCGYWWITIAPMNITTLEETQGPLDIETVARTTFVNDQINAYYFQDQMDVLPKLKINVGARVDDYTRRVDRTGGLPFTPQAVDQTAFSYRGGFVYEPRSDQQFYFGTSSSFTPVTTIPPDGSPLDPSTARNYEVGHRWQGWNGRVDTSIAGYFITRNNLTVQETVTTVTQIGEQTSRGVDLDINADLGGQTHLILNYGYARARFGEADDLTGLTPRFVPANNLNLWLRKDWASGLNAGFGARYLGKQFVDDDNTAEIDGYTIFSGAVGYRTNRWEWTLNAENLFDKDDYFLPGHFSNLVFPGQPINVTSTIRLKY